MTAAFKRPSQTKIVATVGPACDSAEKLRELIVAGVDVFRVNTAHGTLDEHQRRVETIRAASGALGMPVAILVDLPGPKMRLGELPGGVLECVPGSALKIIRGRPPAAADELTTTYEPLIDEVRPGDRIMLADGTVGLAVERVERDTAFCRVVQGGPIRSRQGLNLPGIRLSAPALGPDDRVRARWAVQAAADYVGLSFVRAAADVQELREFLAAEKAACPSPGLSAQPSGSTAGKPAVAPCAAEGDDVAPPQIIAKIEKPEALDQLDAILAAADGIMVARGDLGVEIDIAELPIVQKRIVAACRRARKPVIVATQMLESMRTERLPTRAEATDVANAILDGADACMLSGETAIGEHPRETVEMMHRIALATEPILRQRSAEAVAPAGDSIADAVTAAAGRLAEQVGAKAIVVASATGQTALSVAKQRFLVPALGVSNSPATLRRMCLYWGVIPLPNAPADEPRQLLEHVCRRGREAGWLTPGDRILLVFSTRMSAGRHNGILVHQVD